MVVSVCTVMKKTKPIIFEAKPFAEKIKSLGKFLMLSSFVLVNLPVDKAYAVEVCESINLDWSAEFTNTELNPATAAVSKTLGTTITSEFTYDTVNNGLANVNVSNATQNAQQGVRVLQRSVFPSAGSTTTWSWDTPVENIDFEIVDIDSFFNFTDRVLITIIDENGATIDLQPGVHYTLEGTTVIVEDAPNQFTGTGPVGFGNNADIRIQLPNISIQSVTIFYDNANTSPSANQAILHKDLSWDICASLDIDKPAPAITNDVAPIGSVSVGDTLTYTITATNDGSATQTDVVVSDPLLTPNSITCPSVAANDTCVLTGTYVVQLADAGGTIDNTASVISDQITTPTTDDESTPVDPDASPPVADDDSADAGGDTSVTLDYINNDAATVGNLDPETFDFDPASVGGTCLSTDADGDCVAVSVPGEGTWTVDTSGMVTFTADSSFAGNPMPIDYTVRDDRGVPSNVATITITNVTPVTLSSISNEVTGR